MLCELISEKHGFRLFFVESICDDPAIIEANILVSYLYHVSKVRHVWWFKGLISLCPYEHVLSGDPVQAVGLGGGVVWSFAETFRGLAQP